MCIIVLELCIGHDNRVSVQVFSGVVTSHENLHGFFLSALTAAAENLRRVESAENPLPECSRHVAAGNGRAGGCASSSVRYLLGAIPGTFTNLEVELSVIILIDF